MKKLTIPTSLVKNLVGLRLYLLIDMIKVFITIIVYATVEIQLWYVGIMFCVVILKVAAAFKEKTA